MPEVQVIFVPIELYPMKIIQTTEEELQSLLRRTIKEVLIEAQLHADAKSEGHDNMLTVKDVASLIAMSTRSVAHFTKRGDLTSYKIGSSVRYKRIEVMGAMKAINYGS